MTIKLTCIKMRLRGAEAAQKRTRFVFLVSTIISLGMVVASWNAYLSYYKFFAVDSFSKPAMANGIGIVEQELLKEWVRSRMISVSSLGIQVGVDDAPQLGALTLLIIMIWYYFSVRRENYTIASLLNETRDESTALRWMVFHGINSQTVFTNVHLKDKPPTDQPVGKLGQVPEDETGRFPRLAHKILVFFPVIAVMFTLMLDFLSVYWFPSPFNMFQGQRPIAVIREYPSRRKIETYCWLWWFVTLVLCAAITWLCGKIATFESKTESVLSDYWADLGEKTPPRPETKRGGGRMVPLPAQIDGTCSPSG
jgi:hypothetical protein